MKKLKLTICGYDNEGIVVKFNREFSLNGKLSTKIWWLSWDKLCTILLREEQEMAKKVKPKVKPKKPKR